ncbi:uncharacterized protein LOC110017937 [Phalaenopsis equestris]|uniref:uncharacterized protein LOC110017937 n=1 Tax=Phalaenopsis equestris TaxID=78828 RepID=UPI0009E4910E|nr:uncharacterized protein LOC110017937 [Phalaenopsis equestris]
MALFINSPLCTPDHNSLAEREHRHLVETASTDGAIFLLLTSSSPVVKHVVESAFDRQDRGKQLASLHALGSIAGADRSDKSLLLNDSAEECLKRLIYEAATNSSKLTPSGLFLSVLQQEPEMRLAAYRLISALVARSWCLMEICSRLEITSIVMDADIEDAKMGMEARHQCCAAIYYALSASNMAADAKVAELAGKLQEAVKRGPFLTKRHIEPKPIVITAERF